MEIKSGDILHCYSKTLLSKFIRAISKSKYSHTAMVIEIWGKLFIIDSQARGTTIKTLEDWTKKYNYKFDISRPKFEFTKNIKFKAMEKCGDTPYDFASLIIFQPIFQITGKWIGKKGKDSDKRMYCSKFISYVYGIPHYWSNSPQNVFEFCLKSHRYNTIIN